MPAQTHMQRKLAREIASRRQAEWLLEAKIQELLETNRQLQSSSLGLSDSFELIKTIIDAVPVVVLTCDERHVIEIANSASATVLGYPPQQLVGHHLRDVLPNYLIHKPELEKDVFLVPEMAVTKRDGSVLHCEMRGGRAKVRTKPFIVMVMSDTSTQKTAEALKEGVYKQVSESRRLAAIGALSSGIAHELNTPIQFIGDNITYISMSLTNIYQSYKLYDLLKRECEASGLLPDAVGRVNAFNQKVELSTLVKEILCSIKETMDGISQVRNIALMMKEFSHPGTDAPEPCEINRVVQSAITMCRGRHRNVVALETDLAPGLPEVTCRRGQIQQVVVNLIINAVEAIEEQAGTHGVIHVKTMRSSSGGVRIEISDNGPGIPGGLCEQVFDPFFTTKSVGKGTGQGLALAKDFIVNQHGGTLLLEDRPGFSTTFVIELPLTPPPELCGRKPVPYGNT